jgi:hypothetical protein
MQVRKKRVFGVEDNEDADEMLKQAPSQGGAEAPAPPDDARDAWREDYAGIVAFLLARFPREPNAAHVARALYALSIYFERPHGHGPSLDLLDRVRHAWLAVSPDAETCHLGLASVRDAIRALDPEVLDAARRVPRADETLTNRLINRAGRRMVGPRVADTPSEGERALGAALLFLLELSSLEPEGSAENSRKVEEMMLAYLAGRGESPPTGLIPDVSRYAVTAVIEYLRRPEAERAAAVFGLAVSNLSLPARPRTPVPVSPG